MCPYDLRRGGENSCSDGDFRSTVGERSKTGSNMSVRATQIRGIFWTISGSSEKGW